MDQFENVSDKEWRDKLKTQGYYYIHAHKNRYNSTSLNSYLTQNHQRWYDEMLARFTNNWYNATNLNANAVNSLATAGNKESFMRKVNQELVNAFNQVVKDDPMIRSSLEATVDAYAAIDKYIQSTTTQGQLNAMNEFLTQVSKAGLIAGAAGKELELLLINWKDKQGGIGFNDAMGSLMADIDAAKIKWSKKSQTASRQRVLNVMNQLNSLAAAAQSGELQAGSFKGFAKGIFSTQFGELLAPIIQNKAMAAAGEQMRRVAKNQLTGERTVKQKYIESSAMANYINKDKKRTFKTDAKNNITMTINNFNNEQGGQLDLSIDLGTSVKWYKSLIGKRENLLSGNVGVATESGGLQNRALQIFENSAQHMTNFYNAIAHQDEEVLNNFALALVYRNLDFMIGGYGAGGDFSQLMFVNGQFISVYEILLKSLNNVQTMSFWKSFNPGIGVVFDSKIQEVQSLMPSEETVSHFPSLERAYARAKQQNQKLNQSAISVYVNMKKMII